MCADKHNGTMDETFGIGKIAALRADGITSNAGGINQNLLHLVSSI